MNQKNKKVTAGTLEGVSSQRIVEKSVSFIFFCSHDNK